MEGEAKKKSLAPIYLVRHKDGVDVLEGNQTQFSVEEEVSHALWSPNGSLLAIHGGAEGDLNVFWDPVWAALQRGTPGSPPGEPCCLRLRRFQNSPPWGSRSLRHLQWSPRGSSVVAFWQFDPKAAAGTDRGAWDICETPLGRTRSGTHQVYTLDMERWGGCAGLDERNVLVWNLSKYLAEGTGAILRATNERASEVLDDGGSESWKIMIVNVSPTAAFTLKGVAEGQWPVLKWRDDERWCMLASRSEVVVYDGADLGGSPLLRVSLAGVISTEPAPARSGEQTSDSLVFAAFSPATAIGGEALLRVITIPEAVICRKPDRRQQKSPCQKSEDGDRGRGDDKARDDDKASKRADNKSEDTNKRDENGGFTVSVEKPVGRADSGVMSWSPSGTSVLVLANTIVDSAGENYGGVRDVFLARFDGSLAVKVNHAVAQDAEWNPQRGSDEFVLIEGKAPSEIRLYDADCNMLFEFPVAYRNTVRWDPFGSMLALGGFGNLAGELSFWYNSRKEDHPPGRWPPTDDSLVADDERSLAARALHIIADWREPCTVLCGWAPDGRHFFSASTFPRMKVDNQFKVFDREGRVLSTKTYSQLFDFQWKPELPGTYTAPVDPPVEQPSALAAAKKFRFPKDLVRPSVKPRPARKCQQSGGQNADNLARIEKNRQLDSISDWRAARKDEQSTSSATSGEPTSRRRGSSSKLVKSKREDYFSREGEEQGGTKAQHRPIVLRASKGEGVSPPGTDVQFADEEEPSPAEPQLQPGPKEGPGDAPSTRGVSVRLPIRTSRSEDNERGEAAAATEGFPGDNDDDDVRLPYLLASKMQHPAHSEPSPPYQNDSILSQALSGLPQASNKKSGPAVVSPIRIDRRHTVMISSPTGGDVPLPPHHLGDIEDDDSGRRSRYNNDGGALPPGPLPATTAAQVTPAGPSRPSGQSPDALLSLLRSILPPDASLHVSTTTGRDALAPPPVCWGAASSKAPDQGSWGAAADAEGGRWWGEAKWPVELSSEEQRREPMPGLLFPRQSPPDRYLRTEEGGQPYNGRVLTFPPMPPAVPATPSRQYYNSGVAAPTFGAASLDAALQDRARSTEYAAGLHRFVPDWPREPQQVAPPSLGLPPSDRCWEYVDPKGVVQGPFDVHEMRKWCAMGCFEPGLLVRSSPTEAFMELGRVFPRGTAFGVPFPMRRSAV